MARSGQPIQLDKVRVFIQARMSSSRLPGKMLAPFRGRPLIEQVLARFSGSSLRRRVVVLTSTDRSDDPLADFVEDRCETPVFRGDLDDVVKRFQTALEAYPCTWCVRLSGDSPLMDATLVERMLTLTGDDLDLVSNVVRRTFPSGQSVECVNAETLRKLKSASLTDEEREHVTKVFYSAPERWRLRSVVCTDAQWAGRRMVVDSLEDLRELQGMVDLPESFGVLAVVEERRA